MKSRNGFISNSSTSCFIAIGFFVKDLTEDKIMEFLAEFATKEEIEKYTTIDHLIEASFNSAYEVLKEILYDKYLEIYSNKDNDNIGKDEYFIARSYSADEHDGFEITNITDELKLLYKVNALFGNNKIKLISKIEY